jgi:hypothetical protein
MDSGSMRMTGQGGAIWYFFFFSLEREGPFPPHNKEIEKHQFIIFLLN